MDQHDQRYCYNHETPCPLPCAACEDECVEEEPDSHNNVYPLPPRPRPAGWRSRCRTLLAFILAYGVFLGVGWLVLRLVAALIY